MLATVFGIFLFLIILALIGGSVGLSAYLGNQFGSKFKENSILMIDASYTHPELSNNVDAGFRLDNDTYVGIHDLLHIIDHAKTNDKIKGIYLNTSTLPTRSYANARLLRESLNTFKESGKWIYAYADYYSQGGYYLASVADSVYLNYVGGMDFRGLATEIVFYKDLLDKLGVQPEVFYAGKFKSATEPIRRNDMSEENRTQIRAFINDIYDVLLKDISDSRSLSINELNQIADKLETSRAIGAQKSGLIDRALYKDEFLDILRTKMEVKEYKDLKFTKAAKYLANIKGELRSDEPNVAVVVAEGTILDNSDKAGVIDGDRYAKILRKLREDDDIKAIVLRVNSPGGSVLASDKIWREVMLAKEAGKTVVASMGDYAASGGYYISCLADSIYAQENTITGSIGVFGVNYNFNELANDKLGIHIDTVKTRRFSALGSNIMPTDTAFKRIIQSFIDTTYHNFKSKVAEGRNMDMAEVEEIAQGRVWTGQRALDLGLVDRLGGLNDAIAAASRMSKTDDKLRIKFYPNVKTPFEKLVDDLSSKSVAIDQVNNAILSVFPDYQRIMELKDLNRKVQVRLPFYMEFE